MTRLTLLALTFGLLLTVLVSQLATLQGILYVTVTLLLFSLPGYFVGFWLFGFEVRRHPEALIFGTVLGLALSEYVALALGYLLGWSLQVATLALLLLSLVTFGATRRHWTGRLIKRLSPWDKTDYALFLLLAVILVAFVTVPLLNVGKLTQHGYAYAWLFGFDFLLRSAMTAMVTAGLPPDYPHLAGHTMHYYLASYTVPAFAYSASGKSVSLHSVMQLVGLFNSLLFLGCLFCTLRHFIRHRGALLLTGLVAMLAYSYYDLYLLAKYAINAVGEPAQRLVQKAGLLDFANVSHLYQRYFLVEPQALMGLSVFVFVLLLLELSRYRVCSLSLAVVLGLLIGAEFGIEAWLGLLLAIWFGCVQVFRWFRQRRRFNAEYAPLGLVAGLVTVMWGSFFVLGVYAPGSSQMVSFQPYWMLLLVGPAYLLVEYGPMLLFGVTVFFRQSRRDRSFLFSPLSLLGGLTLLVVFFLSSPVLPIMGVLRGHRTLPLVLLVWTGYFFTEFLQRPRSRTALLLVAGLFAAALPTVLTDIYFTSNVNDPRNTIYVNPADRQAAEWVRRHLPENALLQSEPSYRNYTVGVPNRRYALSLIPNFGERRVVLGEEWIAANILVNAQPIVVARRRHIQKMFQAARINQVTEVTDMYNIDYLYVGPYEQMLHAGFLELLEASPSHFQEVYSQENVHIFKRLKVLSTEADRASIAVTDHLIDNSQDAAH